MNVRDSSLSATLSFLLRTNTLHPMGAKCAIDGLSPWMISYGVFQSRLLVGVIFAILVAVMASSFNSDFGSFK